MTIDSEADNLHELVSRTKKILGGKKEENNYKKSEDNVIENIFS